MIMKLGKFDGNRQIAHTYPNVWARQELSDGSVRLCIAPQSEQTSCLLRLTACLPEPFYLLYVLIVPRGEAQPGRYQSPALTRADLSDFLGRYAEFLDGDGRAHLWVTSWDHPHPPAGTLVYDRHNLIYAYGPIGEYGATLSSMGLAEVDRIDIPSPHSHYYYEEYDTLAQRIHTEFDWLLSELQERDSD